jgi:hypothetical protein
MEESDPPVGVAFSSTERQFCLLKGTGNMIRLNCRFVSAEKRKGSVIQSVLSTFLRILKLNIGASNLVLGGLIAEHTGG